ncbi:MAG: DUF1385 domain-containing protein [Bacillota bacterium]
MIGRVTSKGISLDLGERAVSATREADGSVRAGNAAAFALPGWGRLADVPFVRGPALFLGLFIRVVPRSPAAIAAGVVGLMGFGLLDRFLGPSSANDGRFVPLAIAFSVFLALGLLRLLGRGPGRARAFLSYHGAEHKVSAALRAGLDPQLAEIEDIAVMGRADPYCGTNLAVYMTVLWAFIGAVIGPVPAFPLAISLAVEVHLLGMEEETAPPRWFLTPASLALKGLVRLAALAQMLATIEPGPEEIEVALVAARLAAISSPQARRYGWSQEDVTFRTTGDEQPHTNL